MNTTDQNYRLLQEIEASRLFLIMACQQNPQLLERADERIKQMFGSGASHNATSLQTPQQMGVKERGFTLIELIMVIVIAGIIAIFAAPRMFDADAFKSRGFSDQVQATLRYAQKIAIAQRRNVCVAMTAATVSLSIAGAAGTASACVANLPLPSGGSSVTAPSNITLAYTSAGFNFDALGSTATRQTITVSGEANAIVVEAGTGYVHSP